MLSQGRLVSVWRRDESIFTASPGEPEKEIGRGIDIGAAGGPGGVYAIWTAKDGIRALTPGRSSSTLLSAKGGFASIVALAGGRALAAWEEDGRIVTQEVH